MKHSNFPNEVYKREAVVPPFWVRVAIVSVWMGLLVLGTLWITKDWITN